MASSTTAFKCTSCRKTFASAGNLKRHKTKKKPCDRKSVKARQKESKKKRQQRNKSYYQKKKRDDWACRSRRLLRSRVSLQYRYDLLRLATNRLGMTIDSHRAMLLQNDLSDWDMVTAQSSTTCFL